MRIADNIAGLFLLATHLDRQGANKSFKGFLPPYRILLSLWLSSVLAALSVSACVLWNVTKVLIEGIKLH